jgi:hypothetical protein
MWVRSYFVNDHFPNVTDIKPTGMRVDSWWGLIFFSRVSGASQMSLNLETPRVENHRPLSHGGLVNSVDAPRLRNWFGFQHVWYSETVWYSKTAGYTVRADMRVFPYWFPVLVLSALPAYWFRRQMAVKAGFCASCGYDLRATPHRCPECGTAPAPER